MSSAIPHDLDSLARPDTPLASQQPSTRISISESPKLKSEDDSKITPSHPPPGLSPALSSQSLSHPLFSALTVSHTTLMFAEPTGSGKAVNDFPPEIAAVDTGLSFEQSLSEQIADLTDPVSSVEDKVIDGQLEKHEAATSLNAPSLDHAGHSQLLLPIPTLPMNKSQTSLTFADVVTDGANSDALSPEVAAADIAIAPDGSFVETSSGPAAIELKRRYDQHYGVGPSVRSPYAITAFVNQHGKQMFRVSRRELSAPAAAAAEVEERYSSKSSSESPRANRRSRLSMHALVSPFNKASGSTTRPQTTAPYTSRKLRKSRSIPDMGSAGPGTAQASQQHGQKRVSPITGRVHSHSVNAADISRYPAVNARYMNTRGDIFGELMNWPMPSSSASTTSFSSHSLIIPGEAPSLSPFDRGKTPVIVAQPFGPGVDFDSPSRKPDVDFLPAPRLLREMQSFESVMTARQTDSQSPPSHDSITPSEATPPAADSSDASRPSSAVHIRASHSSLKYDDDDNQKTEATTAVGTEFPSSGELLNHSHYSTDVFDVLQTYRGLPLLDKLSPESEGTTVIKLSLSADDSAAPRNDPRFVIWGDVQPEFDDSSESRESFTDLSSAPSSVSKRRGSKAAKGKSPEPPNLRLTGTPSSEKVLIAATIERWIAQLTSDLNYDELLNFFLTYRTYVSAVDLCHLLICRFHWALQPASSSKDETVRRIVRVRTFVAIRYWLLTFFTVDFLPNRDLRILLANWLNTLIHDPILKKHTDGLGIVRRLVKVAKECKQVHTRATGKPKPKSSPKKVVETTHVLGEKFAEATRKTIPEEEDSDVDLDFLPGEASLPPSPDGLHDPANAHLSTIHLGAGLSPARPSSLPLSALNILQRTDHAPGPNNEFDTPFIQTQLTLPVHNSALSRAFVKTIGRLGRWKRVLNSRSSTRTPLAACADVSAFDLELSVSRDLLTVNGGVEQYLKMIEPQTSSPPRPVLSASRPVSLAPSAHPVLPSVAQAFQMEATTVTTPTLEDHVDSLSTSSTSETPGPTNPSSSPYVSDEPPVYSDSGRNRELPPTPPLPIPPVGGDSGLNRELPPIPPPPIPPVEEPFDLPANQSTLLGSDTVQSSDRPQSFRSSSTDSFGVLLGEGGPPPTFPRPAQSQWKFDVVSIDELDFSDTSSNVRGQDEQDPAEPPGLRKPPRRLPLRRDFEFVRRSEVSSMGIISHESMASGPSSSAHSSASIVGLGGGIHQWQVNALLDSLSNDEENGDVEAALRKLEGQINPEKQQEKASKVDGWVKNIRERMVAGDYGDEEPRFPDDDDEDEEELSESPRSDDEDDNDESASQQEALEPPPLITEPEDVYSADENLESSKTPVPTQTCHNIPAPPGLISPQQPNDSKPAPEHAVPLEILQSRLPPAGPQLSKFGNPELPRVHRSFILNYRAEVLAQHFAMIDRELFMSIKFEELVLDDWMACEDVDVLDWAQYLKDRVRWKAESNNPAKTSALAAVRARFNLIANFVVSEIVLTQPSERPAVVAKLIRIAWRSWCHSNFNTVTAIITALQSDWVQIAMRRNSWNKIGIFENRAYKDLKLFVSSDDDFKFIRQAVESIVDPKPSDANNTSSIVSGGGTDPTSKGKTSSEPKSPSACIPFIGIYLSQLHRLSKLPDLIDPTAPNEAVDIDPITSNFSPPAHPEVFSALAPLPPSMHLEPLVNVHKQRKIAGVIKSLVAGQHFASRMNLEIDKRLFQRCLHLRGIDPETIQRALALYPE